MDSHPNLKVTTGNPAKSGPILLDVVFFIGSGLKTHKEPFSIDIAYALSKIGKRFLSISLLSIANYRM